MLLKMCPAILSCLCDCSGGLISHCFGVYIPPGEVSVHILYLLLDGEVQHIQLVEEVSQVLCFEVTVCPPSA